MGMTFETLAPETRMIEVASVPMVVAHMRSVWPTEIVKNEPMLFSCDLDATRELGGPITRAWLDAILTDASIGPYIIDTRVHMLMPGFWPCIPGWHHDDVPREREDGQPDYFHGVVSDVAHLGRGGRHERCGADRVREGHRPLPRRRARREVLQGLGPDGQRGDRVRLARLDPDQVRRVRVVRRSKLAPRHPGRRVRVALVRPDHARLPTPDPQRDAPAGAGISL